MRGINRVFLVGRLGQEPQMRVSKTNQPWCTMSIATERSRKDGDAWIVETDWHDVKVFGDEAERCGKMLRKGSMVGVEGALTYDTWADDAGQKRRRARIASTRVTFLSDLKERGEAPSAAPADPPAAAAGEDLPF
jgi:single-strand DNA-binding protein